jgi:hypothetical protein
MSTLPPFRLIGFSSAAATLHTSVGFGIRDYHITSRLRIFVSRHSHFTPTVIVSRRLSYAARASHFPTMRHATVSR